MKRATTEMFNEINNALCGKKCWYVSCGGAAGSTFGLAIGEKIRRAKPLKNKSHSEVYRQYEGEANLFVWCTWRLDKRDDALSSSDDSKKGIVKALKELNGKKVLAIQLDEPCWDIHIKFTNRFILHVFCDHVLSSPSFDGNWEVWLRRKVHFFGPGSRHEGREREEEKKGN